MEDLLELDIAILNIDLKRPGAKKPAIVYARCASDVAVSSLPYGPELKRLLAFRDKISEVLLKNLQRPRNSELTDFGHKLFEYIISKDVKRLYDRLPLNKRVRIHIMTDRPDLQSLPWEFLQDPTRPPGPWRDRSVVRVVPTIGSPRPEPIKITPGGDKLRILFVYADPQNQTFVSWPGVRASIERVFSARLPSEFYELKVIRGTPAELVAAFQSNNDRYEIFQFSGHGDIRGGEGHILLLNESDQQSSPLSASQLAGLLNGRGIKLAVLSACLTSAGNAADPFNVVSEALVSSGIPAVVANQLPVPDSSVAAFVGSMYTQLLNTGDIDLAVNEARVKLSIELAVQQDATLEWGIPTLYRHIAGSKIFEPVVQQPPGVQPPVPQPPANA
ncbi:MAG: hypothetical protein QOJ76_915 [Acidobacteriota bacterium]|nr:hypothetical protein [Acidobacteriota bacterium]